MSVSKRLFAFTIIIYQQTMNEWRPTHVVQWLCYVIVQIALCVQCLPACGNHDTQQPTLLVLIVKLILHSLRSCEGLCLVLRLPLAVYVALSFDE
jgi:hypothetical protein